MNKTAIISGAGGALGSEIVKKFQHAGYSIHGFYHSLPQSPGNESIHIHTVDLLDENTTKNEVENIFASESKVDVLVCTAGGFQVGNIEKTSVADLQKQFQINFVTAYNLIRPVYNIMKRQGYGRIFLIGSRQGDDARKSVNTIAYGLSKSLLFQLAEILNEDSKGKVVISVIVPSTIDTKANRESMPEADFSKWVSPDDIADIILFYSSSTTNAIRQPVIKIFGEG